MATCFDSGSRHGLSRLCRGPIGRFRRRPELGRGRRQRRDYRRRGRAGPLGRYLRRGDGLPRLRRRFRLRRNTVTRPWKKEALSGMDCVRIANRIDSGKHTVIETVTPGNRVECIAPRPRHMRAHDPELPAGWAVAPAQPRHRPRIRQPAPPDLQADTGRPHRPLRNRYGPHEEARTEAWQ